MLGVEALQGNDQERLGTQINNTDAETILGNAQSLPEAKAGPRIHTLFAKFAPDVGDTKPYKLVCLMLKRNNINKF